MGNRFSRRRDVSSGSAEVEQMTAAAEQESSKPSQVPVTTQARATENLDVLAEVPETSVTCSSEEHSVTECKEEKITAISDPVQDEKSESEVKDSFQAQPESLVSFDKLPEPEPDVAPAKTPEPVAEPEFVPPPEPKPLLVESPDLHTDLLTQESLPEPLIDFGVPEDIPSPTSTPASLIPDEASNTSQGEENVKPQESFSLEAEESTKTSEILEEKSEVEAAECLVTLGSELNQERVSGVLKSLDVMENDLLNDLIQSDVKIPDDTPIPDMSTPIELM